MRTESYSEVKRSAVPWLRSTARSVVWQTGAPAVLMLVMLLVFGASSPHFLSRQNISTVLTQAVYLILVVIAQTIVLLTGGFDLSVGASVSLVSIVTGFVLLNVGPGFAVPVAVAAGVGVAGLVGVLNGGIVSLFGVSPFIVTLAMMSVIGGLALIVSGGVPIFGLPDGFGALLFRGQLAGIPVPWVVTGLVIGLAYLMLYRTRLGRYWYAIGGNSVAAYLAGVPVRLYIFLAYVIAGIFVGIAGVLLTARVGSGEPNLGATLPLESIAAAVLGGVSLRGGEGSLWGAILGAFFLVFLRNGMDLVGISTYVQMIVTGLLLILATVIDRYLHRG